LQVVVRAQRILDRLQRGKKHHDGLKGASMGGRGQGRQNQRRRLLD
jgi:hypothetical protein